MDRPDPENRKRVRRWKYTQKVLHYLDEQNQSEFEAVVTYYRGILNNGVTNIDLTEADAVFNLICDEYLSADPFMRNLFQIVDIAEETKGGDRKNAWKNICLGSDLDGLIDPIDICPTASQYTDFKAKLHVMIPLFLHIRKEFEIRDQVRDTEYLELSDYFDTSFKIDTALNMVFYTNLKDFTVRNF